MLNYVVSFCPVWRETPCKCLKTLVLNRATHMMRWERKTDPKWTSCRWWGPGEGVKRIRPCFLADKCTRFFTRSVSDAPVFGLAGLRVLVVTSSMPHTLIATIAPQHVIASEGTIKESSKESSRKILSFLAWGNNEFLDQLKLFTYSEINGPILSCRILEH